MSMNKVKKISKGVCPTCGEIMDGRFDTGNDQYVWLCTSCKFDTVVSRKDFENHSILKEIENLRYQAQHNWRTHVDELAEYQEQIADWLQELVEIRKLQQENAEFIYKFYEEYMETHRLKQEEK